MKHTLVVLVENKPGVLARVAGLFSRRGFNIDSLSVDVTSNPNISQMTITVTGDDSTLEQVTKQLNKLVNVIKIIDLTGKEAVARELALIKVKATPDTRSEIMRIVDTFRGRIIDIAPKSVIVEVTGDEKKIDAITQLLTEFGIKETVRTGMTAMIRGVQ